MQPWTIKIIVGFFLALVAQSSVASQWVLVNLNDSGVRVLFDKESIKHDGQYVTVWTKIVYSEPDVIETSDHTIRLTYSYDTTL